MTAKAKIKVIKKGSQELEKVLIRAEKKPAQESAREMVLTVKNWVTDFQQRHHEETKQAIEKFFSPQAQTSEV